MGPPRLWTWLCTHWCPIPASLAWCWWRALSKAQYPPADLWRARFVAFDREDRGVSRDIVESFLAEIASPPQLIDLVEHLMKERCLVRRDGHHLQEHILAHVDHTGQWKKEGV
jgi:hypothetical protein